MKRPQTKFYADTMSDSKVIRSKNVKFVVTSNFSCSTAFFLINIYWSYNWYWYAASSVAILN